MINELKNLKILYLGTPEISADTLSYLLEGGANIVAVITNPDKPQGRKGIEVPPPVKSLALSRGIPVYQKARIRDDYAFLDDIDFDILLTMAYGQILPVEILNKAPLGAYNLHGSLLPEYRGAAPIQRAIMDNKKETGVTLMEMVAKMDAGKMFAKKAVEIGENDNYSSLCKKISKAAADLALSSLLDVVNKVNLGEEQDENLVTFAAKIGVDEERLDLNLPLNELYARIRGLSLTPGGHFILNGLKLKVFKASIASGEQKGEIGEIIGVKKGIFVSVKGGVIRLEEVQLEGKKAMDAASFANGMHNLLGSKLE